MEPGASALRFLLRQIHGILWADGYHRMIQGRGGNERREDLQRAHFVAHPDHVKHFSGKSASECNDLLEGPLFDDYMRFIKEFRQDLDARSQLLVAYNAASILDCRVGAFTHRHAFQFNASVLLNPGWDVRKASTTTSNARSSSFKGALTHLSEHAHEIPGENVELWVAMVDAILQRLGGVDAAEHLNRLQQDMERMDDEQE
jgi:hypothetical protein